MFRRFLSVRRPTNIKKPRITALPKKSVTHQPAQLVPSNSVLSHNAIAIGRQLEMLNVFMGFEQANKYAVYTIPQNSNEQQQVIGYIAEDDSLANSIQRQFFRTHRPFKATVMLPDGKILLKLSRPFQFINSRLSIYDAHDNLLGETHQQWHPWRRQYNLFVRDHDDSDALTQFGVIDEPFLSWDFKALDENQNMRAFISKNLTGLTREIFTDTSVYTLSVAEDLALKQRAVMFGTAVCIDFDYFSRHSGGGGLFKWLPFFIFFE